jgi:hypothetical protein
MNYEKNHIQFPLDTSTLAYSSPRHNCGEYLEMQFLLLVARCPLFIGGHYIAPVVSCKLGCKLTVHVQFKIRSDLINVPAGGCAVQ